MSHCRICSEPLGDHEVARNRAWHDACEVCHYCHESLPSQDQIERCFKEDRFVSHDGCWRNAMRQEFKEKHLPILRQHLNYVNQNITCFYPILNPDDSDISALYQTVRDAEDCASAVSHILGQLRENIKVRDNRAWDFELAEKNKAKREARIAEQKESLDRQAKQEQFAKERENPRLRARRKAVEGLIASGLPREIAESMIPPVSDKDTPNA